MAVYGLYRSTHYLATAQRASRQEGKLKTEKYGMLRISFINTRRRHRTFHFSLFTLYLYQAVFDGVDHKVCGVFAPCLFENIGAVLIHRALRYKEFIGNLLI